MGEPSPSQNNEFMDVQTDLSNALPFLATNNSLGLQEISSAAFPTASAVDYEFVSSSELLDVPQDLDMEQWHRMFHGTLNGAATPLVFGSAVGSPQQELLANMLPTRGNAVNVSSWIQESSSDSVHVRRQQRQRHSLTVTHPAVKYNLSVTQSVVSPSKSVVDQELLCLVDTTHFERFPKSIPPRRLTRGRLAGYYNTSSQSGDSSDDSMDSSDEWTPPKA